jgi:Bacterial archaeo-eukaryotic release factor family 3
MQDHFTRSELRELIQSTTEPCISIYMPAHRAGVETLQEPIRLKNLIRQLRRDLAARNIREAETQRLLQPLEQLAGDYDFWQHQSDGIAIFRSPNQFWHYRLPVEFQELAVAGRRFHLKPLFPMLWGDERFFILALSQNRVRLFCASRDAIREMNLESVPGALREAALPEKAEITIQVHTAGAGNLPGGGLVYHGGMAGAEDRKVELTQFFRQVDRGLHDLLGQSQAPLVVASVDYLFPLYREASTHSRLLAEVIAGNPDNLTAAELRARGWEIVRPHFEKPQDDATQKYFEWKDTPRTSSDIATILLAARQGRVASLFVAVGIQQWGTFDPDSGQVTLLQEPAPDADDLLNLAALLTYSEGGSVFGLAPENMPDGQAVAAVFRY